MLQKASLALALVVVIGCSSASVENPPRFIYASPVDGTTGVTSPLVTELSASPGQHFSAAERTTIAGGLSLATWPDLQPVPSAASVTPAAAGGVHVDDVYTVTASGAVTDGWYAVLLSGLPDDVLWGDPFDHHAVSDGTVAVRLRVGSAPAVSRIDFCYKAPATVTVVVYFSESLAPAVADAVIPISVTASGPACGTPTDIFGPNGTMMGAQAVCAGATLNDPFSVIVGDGLISTTGVSLAPFRAATTPASLAIGTTGCNTYKADP